MIMIKRCKYCQAWGRVKTKISEAIVRFYYEDVSESLAKDRFEVDGLDALWTYAAQAEKTASEASVHGGW